MAFVKYPLYRKALLDFGNDLTAEAKHNLTRKMKKMSIWSTWVKMGTDGWQPTSTQRRTFKASINYTGQLRKSLEPEITADSSGTPSLKILGWGYGENVNDGRPSSIKRFGSPLGKPVRGVPKVELTNWAAKKVKGRDMKTGRFITRATTVFLINRKIKYYGIEPTHFLDDAVDEVYPRHIEAIWDAWVQDGRNNLPDKI